MATVHNRTVALFLCAGLGSAKFAEARKRRRAPACGKSMRDIEFRQTPQRLQKRRMRVCIARPLRRPAGGTAAANSGIPVAGERGEGKGKGGSLPSPSILSHSASARVQTPAAGAPDPSTGCIARRLFCCFCGVWRKTLAPLGVPASWTTASFDLRGSVCRKQVCILEYDRGGAYRTENS